MYPLMVIKRDNTMVKFDRFKICSAIFRASKEVNRIKETQRVIGRIADMVKEVVETAEKHLSVNDIQNLVEDYLIELAHPDVAKAYIKYRYLHDCARGDTDSAFDKIIEEKINAKAVVNQNANVDEASFGGRMGETADGILKKYALDHLITHKIAKNHIENRVYIHDLGHYVVGDHNCLTIPFDKLLEKGFNTRQVDIRPAHSLNTAFQLVAVVFQLQSLCQFGGVSASHLDYTLVPYFRLSFVKHFREILGFVTEKDLDINENDLGIIEAIKNTPIGEYNKDSFTEIWKFALKLTLKELHKGVQGMFHNLNSLQSRSGNQLPFTSINFGTNTTEEGRYIIKAILEGSIEGVGKFHRTSVFPCMIFQVGNGINKYPGDPNYDMFRLALKCTAKRLYPNYVNMDWSNWAGYDKNKPEEFPSTMGCRTATAYDVNGLGHLKDGRGNIAPSTIILPTVAMESYLENKEDVVATFFLRLEKAIDDCIEGLYERYLHITQQSPKSATFMYENGTFEGFDGKSVESALKHGSLAVGQLGLAECLQILIGKNHTTTEGMELAKRIEEFFSAKCKQAKEKYHLNYGVYYTPAENLSHTALEKFRKKYGIIPKVSDREYFTNSMHVPVWEKLNPFEKIDIESQLTGYSTAGCITYVEMESSAINNIEALETLVVYAMDKNIPYFAINLPNDCCNNCGFQGELPDVCPECGSKNIQRLRRVTGYLTNDYKTAFNKGKVAEVEDRLKHSGVKL